MADRVERLCAEVLRAAQQVAAAVRRDHHPQTVGRRVGDLESLVVLLADRPPAGVDRRSRNRLRRASTVLAETARRLAGTAVADRLTTLSHRVGVLASVPRT